MTVTLLDGGMGQELIARAGRATSLWSAQALIDAPDLVRAVHDDYFAAGAEVATTNSYSVLPDRLEPHGILDHLGTLAIKACTLACQSRDAHGSGLVLGSLGPQGFSYQPDKAPLAEDAAEVYAKIVRIHAPFVDAHIFETMSSVDQLKGALMGGSVTGKPVWVAVSVDDQVGTKLRSGEDVTDILPLLQEYRPAAVLVNCSVPEAVTKAVPLLADCGLALGAYANGFTGIHKDFSKVGATVDMLSARTDLSPETYADFADKWVAAGATLIGGCCEVGPAHIRELSRRLKGAPA
ncbi:homocysteine S-methyltransferase family protein [Litoreibacter janthinus]|uniref:Homocysteine S-methyltransferase n=1 Tax=Litoreibacter janthinus TaxID=670154 RepID=A0A1I6G2Z9_9RHOB|nr:homocysteine S-methyltransferase family protein [Litoreibacter janthinus]SFR36521.1 homocysteine S-methyltransferase [Litoreibacter janthinus]